MKTRHLSALFLVVSCISCQHVREVSDGAVVVHREDYEFWGKEYCFDIAKSVLDSAPPRWYAKAQFPPLSPRKAEAVALKEARQIRPDVRQWIRESINLVPLNDLVDNGHWYYLVKLRRGDIDSTGVLEYLDIPVLMNGRVAERCVQPASQ